MFSCCSFDADASTADQARYDLFFLLYNLIYYHHTNCALSNRSTRARERRRPHRTTLASRPLRRGDRTGACCNAAMSPLSHEQSCVPPF
jgi:hypothetical protein